MSSKKTQESKASTKADKKGQKQEKRLSAFFVPQDSQDGVEQSSMESLQTGLGASPIKLLDKEVVTPSFLKKCLDDLSKEIKKDLSDTFSDIKTDLVELKERLYKLEEKEEDTAFQLQAVKDTQIKMELKLKELEDKTCELEDRTRRLNLRFRNIPEDILDAQLYDFLLKYFNYLGVSTAQQEIKLPRYHRLSYRKKDQMYPRDVIVAFDSYDLRSQILQTARKTKIKDEEFTAIKVLTDVSFVTRQRRNAFSTVFPCLKKFNLKFKWTAQSALLICYNDIWKSFKSADLVHVWLKNIDK
ncbi:Hypothetical predicted protein [Pelobates cultripes]|uniref:Uncharacterized protein n=1 Tax=Pelobates cultripes TaxID=61616 RepID=A0AAD1VVG9_PELCU|nr:Hypothetical predicted protein [Pelobates cultripes]